MPVHVLDSHHLQFNEHSSLQAHTQADAPPAIAPSLPLASEPPAVPVLVPQLPEEATAGVPEAQPEPWERSPLLQDMAVAVRGAVDKGAVESALQSSACRSQIAETVRSNPSEPVSPPNSVPPGLSVCSPSSVSISLWFPALRASLKPTAICRHNLCLFQEDSDLQACVQAQAVSAISPSLQPALELPVVPGPQPEATASRQETTDEALIRPTLPQHTPEPCRAAEEIGAAELGNQRTAVQQQIAHTGQPAMRTSQSALSPSAGTVSFKQQLAYPNWVARRLRLLI